MTDKEKAEELLEVFTTIRAEEIWEAFKSELIVHNIKEDPNMIRALSFAIRKVSERLYTDLPELGDPSEVIDEIADELEKMI